MSPSQNAAPRPSHVARSNTICSPSGLAARRDLRLSELDEQLCLLADFEADLQGLGFERGGHRQHDVGNFGCRGHEQVGLDEEIQAAQGLATADAVRVGHHHILAEAHRALIRPSRAAV